MNRVSRLSYVLIGFSMLLAGPALAAVDKTPSGNEATGNARVDALLVALSHRDQAGIQNLLGGVQYILDTPQIVRTKEQFVEIVGGCKVVSTSTNIGIIKYNVVWKCGDGSSAAFYNASMATTPPFAPADGSKVTVMEFTKGQTNPVRHRAAAPAPMGGK